MHSILRFSRTKRIALPLLAACIGACFIPNAFAYDRDKLMDSFLSIVMIRGYNPDGSMAYGSGVVVSENKVITNCHILRQTKQPWISRGEDSYAITSIQADRYRDLCLVSTDNLPLKPVALGKASNMKKGDEVIAIGHSSGTPAPLTSAGVLKSIYPYSNGNIIRSTARFAMGASGSGLFNGKGELIGINTFKSPGRSAYFYALPIEWLAELEKLPLEKGFPIDGMAFWEEQDEQKPYFMQMAIPEIKQDWTKLATIASHWIQAEPASTEAWYELGRAQENLGLKAEALIAYRKSIQFEPRNTDSLYRIGVISSENGDQSEVHNISLALLDIDKELADEFNKSLGCNLRC